MSGPVDKAEFYQYLSEIEEGMGFLKGNELAWHYLIQAEQTAYGKDGSGPDGTTEQTIYLDPDFKFPNPYADFQVTPGRFFQFVLYADKEHEYGPNSPYAWVQKVQQNAIIEWHSGANWANGLASYLGEMCAPFMEPDTGTLLETCLDLRNNVVRDLDAPARADWANIGALLGDWHGDAALSFGTFYNNYASSVAIYALFSGYVFAGMAAATKIIDGTQVGALNFVKSIRDALREQLHAWADRDMWPTDPPKTPAWLAKTEQVASDAYSLLDHVPVVSTVKGYVDKGVSIAGSVEKIAIDLGATPPHTTEPFHAMDSDEAYSKLTTTLSKTLNDYHQAMDNSVHAPPPTDPSQAGDTPFSADAALSQLQEEKSRYDFALPSVPDQSLYSSDSSYRA